MPEIVIAGRAWIPPTDLNLRELGKTEKLKYLISNRRRVDVKVKGGKLNEWDEATGEFGGNLGGKQIDGTIIKRIPTEPTQSRNLLKRKILGFFRNKAKRPNSQSTRLNLESIDLPQGDELRYYGFRQKYGDVSTVDPANAGRASLGRDGTNILEKRQLEDFIKKTNQEGNYEVKLIDDGDYRIFSIKKIQ